LGHVVNGGKHPVETAFRPRIALQNLGDCLLDGMLWQRFSAILCDAVQRRLRRKPITSGLLIKVSTSQLQFAQRLSEDRKLIAGLDAG
jgi:hypothetical protein